MKTLFGTTLLGLAMLSGPAALADGCRNSSFKGVYSALAKGEFVNLLGPGLDGPTTRIGHVEVDGKGNTKISAVTSLNGVVLKESYTGNYTINPDCTASVVLNIPFPDGHGGFVNLQFHFAGVVSEDFQQMDIMLVNPPGSTVGLTLRQQGKSNCSDRDLFGGYTVDLRGFTNLFTAPKSFYRLGRIVFNGRGGFSAQTNTSTGGVIASDNFSGSYDVDRASCTFTITYGGGVWSGVLKDNSTGANVIVSGPVTVGPPLFLGDVVSGTLTEQQQDNNR